MILVPMKTPSVAVDGGTVNLARQLAGGEQGK